MQIFEQLLQGFYVLVAMLILAVQTLFGGASLRTSPPPASTVATSVATSSQIVATTTTVQKSIPVKSVTVTQTPITTVKPSTPPTPPPPPPEVHVDPETINVATRAALVNILCRVGGQSISGSGVFIDTRGVILTNAHVAQFLLLRDYPTPGNIECTVRTGSPARASYTAEILYLSPAWIVTNASQIKDSEPTGTGEDDYALLLITGGTVGTATPSTFPSLPMSSREPSLGARVLLAAYPAGFLGGQTLEQSLYASSAFATVAKLYTLSDDNTVDVFSIGGSVVAQSGSSGGAVVRATDGNLIGLIVTETASSTTAGRDLHALSLSYIDRDLRASGLGGIFDILSSNVAALAKTFNADVAPTLRQKLVDALNKK